ncbi:hypothetical protein HZU77_010480 [Neisseriaceae bacterium TC5R-5]|nr:hypothetical protein [Neisseriaceae bacterium TC5R-5]
MGQRLSPFALNLQPSRLWLGLVLLTVFASIMLILCYLPWVYALLLPLEITLAVLALRANGWFAASNMPWRLEVDARGRLRWYQAADVYTAEVLDDCFISAWLVVLNVHIDGRRHSVMLWPDSAPAEARRQLRVYLRWFQLPTVAES